MRLPTGDRGAVVNDDDPAWRENGIDPGENCRNRYVQVKVEQTIRNGLDFQIIEYSSVAFDYVMSLTRSTFRDLINHSRLLSVNAFDSEGCIFNCLMSWSAYSWANPLKVSMAMHRR